MSELLTSACVPKPDIRAVFFDVDGTLLDKEGRYSEKLKYELQRIQAMGVRTAIASGRPPFAARFLIDDLGINSPGVFCTGAQIYAPASDETVSAAPLDMAENLRFLQRLRELSVYYEIYAQHDFYVETDFGAHVSRIHAHHLRRTPVNDSLETVLQREMTFKWILGAPKTQTQNVLKQLELEFPNLVFAYAAFPACPDWIFTNVISKQACKEKAFYWLMDYYQITPEQVACFGDSHSDETFLRLAGYGVAMGNASAEVKSSARYVTTNAWEDGVAYALERLF